MTMLNIIIKGSYFLTFLFLIIFLCLLIQYKNILKQKIIRYSNYIIIIRSIILLLIMYLLINPVILYNKNFEIIPEIGLLIDTSKSINIHQLNDSINYIEKIDSLKNYLIQSGFRVNVYQFSDSVESISNINDLEFNGNKTNYNQLSNVLINKQLDKLILITDGISTYGKQLEQTNFNIPVFTIGIGDTNNISDIKIDKIQYDNKIEYQDSLEINYIIKSIINDSFRSKLIIENSNKEIVFTSDIYLDKGHNLLSGLIKINIASLSNTNTLTIVPLDIELNKKNNSIEFDLDMINKTERILLVSGNISSNTFFIKKNLKNKKNSLFDHIYRINNNKWNKNINQINFKNYDLIVFDDFCDYNYFSSNKNNSIILFEGPSVFNNNFNCLNKIFNIKIEINKEQINSKLVNSNTISYKYNYDFLPPFNKNYFYYTNEDNKSLLKYNDLSDAVIKKNNIIGIFIPEIGDVYRKIEINKEKKILDNLINDLVNVSLDKDTSLIAFSYNNNKYRLGETIKINLKYSPMIDPLAINKFVEIKAIQDSTTYFLNIDYNVKNDNYYCLFNPELSGNWKLNGQINYDDKKILLKSKNIIVQDYDIESDYIIQNLSGLKLLSNNTGGNYINIKNLSISYSNFNFKNKIKNKIVEINTFNNFKYLFVIIILLGIEWYYRKRKGLL